MRYKNIAHTSNKKEHTLNKKEGNHITSTSNNSTRIVIDNDKVYIIADVNKVNTKEDFISECSKYYHLSNEINLDDIEIKHVTIQSVIKQSQDASSQRIQKRYRFTNLNLGTTVYALNVSRGTNLKV